MNTPWKDKEPHAVEILDRRGLPGSAQMIVDRELRKIAAATAALVQCSSCGEALNEDGRTCPGCGGALCFRCLEECSPQEVADHLIDCWSRERAKR